MTHSTPSTPPDSPGDIPVSEYKAAVLREIAWVFFGIYEGNLEAALKDLHKVREMVEGWE